ncbi:MAG: MATE family efflux transporter [Candidatus Scatosoma sp.]
MSAEKDLTSGNLWKQMLTFSLPLMLSNILQVLFNMSDVAIVGKFGGRYSLGAVGSTSTLAVLFTGFLIGMGSGVNALTAHYLGAKKQKDVREAVHTSAIVCFIAGWALCAVLFFSARGLLVLVGTKDVFLNGAVTYLKIYAFGLPALALYNFGNGVLSAAGDTRRPLIFLSVAGAVNIMLNLFFVIFCRMDVAGVALASTVSPYISAALIFISLLKNKSAVSLRLAELKITPEKAKKILALGVPAGCQNAIFAVANLFIQSAVNYFDETFFEGNSAAANSDALVYDVMAAYYTACSSFMGQNFGAGKKDRMLACYKISLIYSFCTGALMGGALLIFGRQFLALFTSRPEVIDEGMKRLVIMSCSYAFSAFMDNTIAASRGLGKSLVPTVIVISGSCVFRIVWIYTVFAHFHTVFSLYFLYPCSWFVTAAAEIAYFTATYKKIAARMPCAAVSPLSATETAGK